MSNTPIHDLRQVTIACPFCGGSPHTDSSKGQSILNVILCGQDRLARLERERDELTARAAIGKFSGRQRFHGWPPKKVWAFVACWNDDVDIANLRERFGIRKPSDLAAQLRAKGYPVKLRHQSAGQAPK